MMPDSAAPPVLEMRGIKKSFGNNAVLTDINLAVQAGEVLALVGENGAGKSTLMKILAGVYQPDGGEIRLNGKKVKFSHPAQALENGIAMIYQELSLAPHLTVAENIFLGREPVRFGFLNRRELIRQTAAILEEYGFQLNPHTKVGQLSIAARQQVEITRATLEARKILVMDEPTSSLTTRETEDLFRLIRHLKAQGLVIIYISHRLEELELIADKLIILRDGAAVFAGKWGEISEDEIIRQMSGRELTEIFPRRTANVGNERLQVKNLAFRGKFSDVSFSVKAGEIVGIAGLAGAGRTALIETIFGINAAERGEIAIDGKTVAINNTSQAVEHKIALLTGDRKKKGLFLNLSAAKNLTVVNLQKLVKAFRLQTRRENEVTRKYLEKLQIRPPNPAKIIGTMSGGNQQKTLLARWLFADARIFLVDEPTRGVDVAARAKIYLALNELAENGLAILMVSSDLPELLGMTDKILVMRRGNIVAELETSATSQEEILRFATLE